MSDDLDFIVIDDIPEYVFCIPDDEELENVIPIKGEDGSFKYEKVAELPETGEDGVLYLVPKPHETQTAGGNPISINVTEGAGKLSDLKLDGEASQQTYTGKNLMPTLNTQRTMGGVTFTPNQDGSITLNGTSTEATSYPISNDSTTVARTVRLESGTYTLNGDYNSGYFTQLMYTPIGGSGNSYARATFTLTEPVMAGEYIRIREAGLTFNNLKYYPQLELGSQATDYEPYVGGIPSPNPNYPQSVNNVTGTQTIDINGTSYPISLGNIWLAKIGTYRDRIYKNDGKWYVEKQVGKQVLSSSDNITLASSYTNIEYGQVLKPTDAIFYDNNNPLPNTSIASFATYENPVGYDVADNIGKYILKASAARYFVGFAKGTGLDAIKSALNGQVMYYALATPTTTQITDTNLINQLEAARNAGLANGTNVISNTATGNNLASNLELSYYEYDPTNKYNKWLWLDDDAAYEQM